MAGIKDYSSTASSNTSIGGVSVAEGMLPSNINNALRAVAADIREWYNDSQWVEYGDGDGAYTATRTSGTAFTISGVNVTSAYHANRRIKLIDSAATLYGTISSSSFSSDTTVNVTWDSGSITAGSITSVYLGILTNTNTSIPGNVIGATQLADGSVTTVKLGADSVTNAKIADDSIDSEHYVDGSIDTVHIADSQVTTAKIADTAITTAKITDANVTTAKIANSGVTTAKIAADAIDGTKIADDAIDSEHYTDASIDTAHIGDSQITTAKIADSGVTTAKINDDAVTAAKIADAVLVTNSEHSSHTADDVTLFTTQASDARYFRQDSSETISSGNTWSASDSYVATTSAIDNRIIDLIDDVGGFVAIANETSFPAANPDVNNGTGTIVSIKEISSTRTPSSGTVTIANGQGSNTVTITGCGSTVLTAGFGVLVETTSTLNTYTFHRLQPKATEVTTVASISSNITTVANNDSNITAVAGNATNINTVASNNTNVTNVGGSIANVNTVAGNTTNINTVASNNTNVTNVGGSISNVNTVAGSIANVNTTAANITGVNSFGERYRVASSAPTSSLDSGDLYFDTTADTLKVYGSSGWQNAGSSVNGTSARFKYVATSNQTTFSGSDADGNTLAYDSGYIDVYMNGVHLDPSDYTATSGSSIVLASGAASGDIIYVVGFGTFNVAAINAANISSGTINEARLPASALGAVWETKTSNFTGEARKNYFVDTSGGAVTATLPSSGTAGDEIHFLDVSGTFDTNNLTVARNSHKIQGAASDLTVATERAGFTLVYYNATQGWLLKDV